MHNFRQNTTRSAACSGMGEGGSRIAGVVRVWLAVSLIVLAALWTRGIAPVSADEAWYTNPETGYQVVLQDTAALLTEDQLQALGEVMKPLTAYGSAGFFTVNVNGTSTAEYAEQLYGRYLRGRGGAGESGTLFLIDMDNRNIYIYSEGEMYRTITRGYANTITDNVYRRASDGDYYQCAYEAFEQEHTLLEGRKIAQPMKYISNALLALVLALLIHYLIVRAVSGARKPSESELLQGLFADRRVNDLQVNFIRETKQYSPVSSGSGSGGGHGGGGGGGHHGGGGGHHF